MWTPPSDYEENNWVVTLQLLDDSKKWRDFDYKNDVLRVGSKLTFYATFVATNCPYTDREWRLIVVDQQKYNEANNETLAEFGDLQRVPDKGGKSGETSWFGHLEIGSSVAAAKAVRIGMVDQQAREAKSRSKDARSPLGVATSPCNVK